jgi:ssDNA-binding Zn-finger/Zn-ribbon topoisomerase 1
VTDEELEAIKLEQCPSCNSKMTSVRRATRRWWLVGCVDCFNKIMCEKQFVERAAAKFNEYARRVNNE